jgi:hypothetical protein
MTTSNMSESSDKDVEMAPLVPKNSETVSEGNKAEQENHQTEKHAYSSRKALNSSLLYCFCSVSMVLANKSLASRSAYILTNIQIMLYFLNTSVFSF